MGFVVLNFVRRRIVSMIYSAITILFWGWVCALGIYVYSRGLDQSFEDLMKLFDFFSELEQKGEQRGQGIARQKAWEAQRKSNRR